MWSIFKRKLIYSQIDEFIKWKSRLYPTASESDRQILSDFCKKTGIEDVSQVSKEIIQEFQEEFFDSGSEFWKLKCLKSIRCLLRYFKTRGVYYSQVDVADERYTIYHMKKPANLITPEALEYYKKCGARGGRRTKELYGVSHFKKMNAIRNDKYLSTTPIAKGVK